MHDALAPPAVRRADPLLAWRPARQQRAFRQLLTAFSYPGRIVTLAEAGEDALQLLLATLADAATSLADTTATLHHDDWRRLGVARASVEAASFVLADGRTRLGATPALGSLEDPEHGATVIVLAERLGEGTDLQLRGPGINGTSCLPVAGVDAGWWSDRAQWNAGFPMGVDLLLLAGHQLAALPRTTRVTPAGEH